MKRQESMGKWISILFRQIHNHLNKKLKPYDLGASHIHVFKIIFRNDGINQENISKMLYLDKANIGRAVNKLMKVGYVRRDVDPGDKRAYILHITKKGKEFDVVLRIILNELTNQILTGFSDEQKKMAFEILQKMHKNL